MSVLDYTTSDNKNFFPTPKTLVEKLIRGVEYNDQSHKTYILEPSAGKGDLAEGIKNEWKNWSNKLEVDCIEIDTNLQAVLEKNGFRVVWDDFLTYKTFKHYDYIIMNPPFDAGDKHLTKAVSMMEKHGGKVHCLLNAQTLKNPNTKLRKGLIKTLERLDAHVEYIKDGFANAERKTSVEVALIKVSVHRVGNSAFFEQFERAERVAIECEKKTQEVGFNSLVERLAREYNIEVQSGISLIKEYQALNTALEMRPEKKNKFTKPILKMKLTNADDYYDIDVNEYVEQVRLKFWSALLDQDSIVGNLTSKMRESYQAKIQSMANIEFNLCNIQKMINDINFHIHSSVESSLEELFDKLTVEVAYGYDGAKTVHLYDGWKTNKAHAIGKKVIVPYYSRWHSSKMIENDRLNYGVIDVLSDIEQAFNYLQAETLTKLSVRQVIEQVNEVQSPTGRGMDKFKKVEFKYFVVDFFIKGTMHLHFKDMAMVGRLNRFVGLKRNWLPPTYGKKSYEEMDFEEQTVVDSFEGAKVYKKVAQDSKNHLLDLKIGGQLLIT